MKVLIIGGGASGMMAALSALENPNNTVTLLERQSRVGKKLLATGNGRCNLTNRNIRLSHYHGEQPEFARFALESFYVGRTLAFFERLGLLTVTEDSGKVYPLSDQASSVLDVLRFALSAQGANIVTSCDIVEVKHKARGYEALSATGETYFGDKLIIACGGAAGKKLGGSKSGYHLLEQLGHSTTALFPSLTQIKTDPAYVKALKGVRADAHVQLRKDGETLQDSFGEVQFTDFGLSGPEAFTLSRAAATGGDGQELALDFFREYGDSVLLDMLQEKREKLPELAAEDLFAGMLQSRLGRMIVKRAGLKYQTKLKELTDEQLLACVKTGKWFTLEVTGVMGFDSAQVTAKRANLTQERSRAPKIPGFSSAERCWTWTATAAGLTSSGRGRPDTSPASSEKENTHDSHPGHFASAPAGHGAARLRRSAAASHRPYTDQAAGHQKALGRCAEEKRCAAHLYRGRAGQGPRG